MKERIEYWCAILRIPEDEIGARQLREMATRRLEELGVARRPEAAMSGLEVASR